MTKDRDQKALENQDWPDPNHNFEKNWPIRSRSYFGKDRRISRSSDPILQQPANHLGFILFDSLLICFYGQKDDFTENLGANVLTAFAKN